MENVQTPGKCKHPGCKCSSPSTEEYCSEHCRNAGEGGGSGECMCGHPECGSAG